MKYDILVVGGGFAGVGAAISAARQGKKTLLIEKYNCLGGAAVYDLVNPFMRYWTYSDDKTKKIMLSDGIFGEIVNEIEKLGGFIPDSIIYFNEEILKLVLNRMAIASGVELLYQTYVTGVTLEGDKIKSVTVSNVSGTSQIEADYFVDATGDANLSAMSGIKYTLGRESDNLCQPMTLCFRLANVDTDRFYNEDKANINPLYTKLQNEGKITNPRENVLVFRNVTNGVLHFNTTRVIKLNPTDARDVTKAEIIAREQVFEIIDFLRSNFPSFKNCTLISTGLQIGVRESRMIVGEHTLTQDEIVSCTKFEDGIAACNYDIDIHSPDGSGTSHYYFPDGQYYTIPYRCLVPENSTNLLVAGRCISATHEAQASLRIMPVCCTLGEAAGVAAAVAHSEYTAVDKVNIDKVRALLRQNGAVID